MYSIYVLYSEKYNKIYVGVTSNIEERFKSHNELGTKGWTMKFRPWIIIYTEEYIEKSIALSREKQLKSAQGRLFIRSLIEQR